MGVTELGFIYFDTSSKANGIVSLEYLYQDIFQSYNINLER